MEARDSTLDSVNERESTGQTAMAPLFATCAASAPGAQFLEAPETLAVVRWGEAPPVRHDAREFWVPLDPLIDEMPVEIWRSREPVEHGWVDDLGFTRNSAAIFVQLALDESRGAGIEATAHAAYTRLQSFLESTGYPHPIRTWNYVREINRGDGDAERYKLFNAGRARVVEAQHGFEGHLPAASAIGTNASGLHVHALAVRQASVQIENPRQVSAFRYPRLHGLRSPSFSRARLACWPRERHLYLAGTASVVGHRSVHADDCIAQLDETLCNIASILKETTLNREPRTEFGWADLRLLRVYLRDPQDLSCVQATLAERLGARAPVVFLRGDICRQDLAIEIEGLFVALS